MRQYHIRPILKLQTNSRYRTIFLKRKEQKLKIMTCLDMTEVLEGLRSLKNLVFQNEK